VVDGALCNQRATILLDTGSDTSILSLDLARRLGLRLSHSDRLKVHGIGGTVTYVTAKASVKITLGMSVVYYMDSWCGNVGDVIQCLLGMNFMYSAGPRQSTREGVVRLPDEESIPLRSTGSRPKLRKRTPVCVQGDLYLPAGRPAVVRVIYGRDDPNLVVWLRRGKEWLPSVITNASGRPDGIRLVNVSGQAVSDSQHHGGRLPG
jgi:hypothetical protein